MEYVIATTVSTDEIHLADGTVFGNQPGSAGFYASGRSADVYG